MTIYMKMQFPNMPKEEKDAIIQGLLRYCQLDTLAMVMIFEAWGIGLDKLVINLHLFPFKCHKNLF